MRITRLTTKYCAVTSEGVTLYVYALVLSDCGNGGIAEKVTIWMIF